METYKCKNCEKTLDVPATATDAPECCGGKMTKIEPLPVCRSSGAEHSRYDAEDEPCDDGRGN